MNITPKRRVVCAAVRDSIDGLVICGPRHFDMTMHRTIDELVPCDRSWPDADQGFVDQWGVFMSREEAHIVATEAGQILRRVGGDSEKLYSENLY